MTERTRPPSGRPGEGRHSGRSNGASGPSPESERELALAPAVQRSGSKSAVRRDEAAPQAAERRAAPDFDTIVERYGPRLYALAYRLSGSREDAEDLSQEAMVRAYRGSNRFRGESDFYTYVYRIVINLWNNRLRRNRRWRLIPFGDSWDRGKEERGGIGDPSDPGPGPHERLVGREQTRRVQDALSHLDPGLRAVLVLRVAEDLEYEEIAKMLRIPIGTVRSRLARARSRIRRLLME